MSKILIRLYVASLQDGKVHYPGRLFWRQHTYHAVASESGDSMSFIYTLNAFYTDRCIIGESSALLYSYWRK